MPDHSPDRARLGPEVLDGVLAGTVLVRLGAADRVDLPVVDGAALYCATSGSTRSTPQVVAIAAETVRDAVDAAHERIGGPGAWLLTLPEDHIAGFMVRARAHVAGQPLVVGSASGFSAQGFTRDVERLHAVAATRRYGSLVPTQLHRVLGDAGATAAAASLDAVLVGGAAAPAPLLRRAREAGVTVVTTYGMTETVGGCVYDGRPLRGTRVELEGERIRLSGAQVALGYVTEDGLDPFRGTVLTRDRGRWQPGDDGRDRLVVLGRSDDVIVTGGVNVDPHAVDEVALGVPGVEEAATVGVPDPEWGQVVCLALTVRGRAVDDVVAEVQDLVRARLGPPSVPRRTSAGPGSLPLRGPGKIDRRRIADAFATGRD